MSSCARHVGNGAPVARGRVTIILTTHYIEEAEAMADRSGVINRGEIILSRQGRMMRQLGRSGCAGTGQSADDDPGTFSRYGAGAVAGWRGTDLPPMTTRPSGRASPR